MKLKFRYALFILLYRSFISADSVRAVDSDTETVSSFISADRVRAVDSDTETVIHNALVDVLSLELGVRYPNVPWRSTHRRRFAGLTNERKACLLNTCDAEKCAAVLASDQFHFLHTCSTREFKNLLRFPLDVVEDFLSRAPQEFLLFLRLNDDELNVLLGFSPSRILKFRSNPKQFSSILKVGLNYFRPLNHDQFNNVFKIFWTDDIKELKRFTPEHIPVLLETEHLEKSKRILEALGNNYKKLETKPIMRLLNLPFDAVEGVMYGNDQKHHPFLKLNDDEFTTLRGFSDARIIEFAWNSELFSSLLYVGLQHFQPLHDDQFNNVFKIGLRPVYDNQFNKIFEVFCMDHIKELKRFTPEHIPVLLETEHLEKSKRILEALRNNYQASQVVETQSIMRLLHLPLEALTLLTWYININSQPHPFLKLNDDEFTTLRGFSDARIIQFVRNPPRVFSSLLDVGLEYFQPLHDDQFNNVFKILWTDDIKELKRFAPEHIPVLLETENLEKTETILYCLRTKPQASQMLEPQTTMRFLHLPLDAVKKLMHTFNPQRHGSFVHLNDDEFNEFKKFSTDRMKTLIGHGEILPDILKLGLEQVRNLPDDQFNNVFEFEPEEIRELKKFSFEDILVLLETEHLEKSQAILYCLSTNYEVSQIVETKPIMQLLHLPLEAVEQLMYDVDPQLHGPFLQLNQDEFNEFKKFSIDRMETLIGHSKIFPDILKLGLEQVRNLPDDEFNTLIKGKLGQVQTD